MTTEHLAYREACVDDRIEPSTANRKITCLNGSSTTSHYFSASNVHNLI